MDLLNFNSVENVPGFEARAAFTLNSATVFKEDVDIAPTTRSNAPKAIYTSSHSSVSRLAER